MKKQLFFSTFLILFLGNPFGFSNTFPQNGTGAVIVVQGKLQNFTCQFELPGHLTKNDKSLREKMTVSLRSKGKTLISMKTQDRVVRLPEMPLEAGEYHLLLQIRDDFYEKTIVIN